MFHFLGTFASVEIDDLWDKIEVQESQENLNQNH